MEFDFLVIGGGSGGVRAARLSASFGAKVALVEKSRLGGTCVNLGCVPKKLFVYASEFSHYPKIAEGYGWQVNSKFCWQKLIENKDKEIARLNDIYEKLLLQSNVKIIRGTAELVEKNKILVNGKSYLAKKILLATGGYPFIPSIEGIEHTTISDEIFSLKELPSSIAIVGAGYIAIEFAGIFNSLGVKTTLIHRNYSLLRGFESDSVNHLVGEMKQKGVEFFLGQTIEKIEKKGKKKILYFSNGEKKEVDLVFFAIGRKPNLKGLNLDKIGVNFAENGGIEVDEFFQTSQKNIYAVGDIINRINLTPVAIRQGVVVANYLFQKKKISFSYKNIPTAIFSQPNLASVGYTEKEAREKYEVEIFKSTLTPMKYSLSSYKEKALLKLIIEKRQKKSLVLIW